MNRLRAPSLLRCVVLLASLDVAAVRADPCPAARFVVVAEEPPLAVPGGPAIDVLDFDPAGTIDLAPCGPGTTTLRARPLRTVVRTEWETCGGLENVRLELRIRAPDCLELRGKLRARRVRRQRFQGVRGAEPPSGLVAAVVGPDVNLSWAAEAGETVRLLRRLDTPPTGADDVDAVRVFDGVGTSATHALAELLPTTLDAPRTYHYAVFGCDAAGCLPDGSRTSLALTVGQALRGGGYTIHWRHAAATVCTDRLELGPASSTSVPDWWKSCDANCATATARQLDAFGVDDAIGIGQDLRTLGIPIGRVLSSEFCRNVQTAELMAFGPPIEQLPALTYFVYDEPMRCAGSYALLGEVPAPGTNTALIGHAGFGGGCPVLADLAWGEAAIFKPDGIGGSTLVARVVAGAWLALP